MPSFSDSIFLFVLALLLFGPKKLPVLARELGKWVGEFRRASNEFKMQMEEELRLSEQEDRNKQIAAMEAAAPLPAALPGEEEPEHPHLKAVETTSGDDVSSSDSVAPGEPEAPPARTLDASSDQPASEPLAIATAGELRMMPPGTGLPTPRGRSGAYESEQADEHASSDAVNSFVNSLPQEEHSNGNGASSASETAAHSH